MKIGSRDIRHLAIIGAAGAAGVVATLVVVGAADRRHARYERVQVEREQIRSVDFNVRTVTAQRRGTRTARIRVRGSSDASPVVYIDGVRVQPGRWWSGAESATGVDDLNPEDIAKIDVVKGDKALEYGTEAKERGVILVTTKEGSKKGSGKKKDSGEGAEKGP